MSTPVPVCILPSELRVEPLPPNAAMPGVRVWDDSGAEPILISATCTDADHQGPRHMPAGELVRHASSAGSRRLKCKACLRADNRKRREDPEYRERINSAERKRYREDSEYRERNKERQRKYDRKRREDPEVREREAEAQRKYKRKRREDPEYRAREAEAKRKRYREDPEYRERINSANRKRRADPEVRERYNEARRKRHVAKASRTDEELAADCRRIHPEGMKRCRVCRESLPLECFSNDRGRADGLHSDCSVCDNSRRYREAMPGWIEAEISPHVCYYCDAPYEHVDHFIPLALGGADEPWNFVPSCSPCNLSKSAREPAEFLLSHLSIPGPARDVIRRMLHLAHEHADATPPASQAAA